MTFLLDARRSLSRRLFSTRRRLRAIEAKLDLQAAWLQSMSAASRSGAGDAAGAAPGRWRIADYKGFQLLLDSEGFADNYVLGPGAWDRAQMDYLFAPLASGAVTDATFLDIGAYFGIYAFEALTYPGFASVVAFEANETNHAQLAANALMNAASAGRLRTLNRVVTDRPGFSRSELPRDNPNRGMARVSAAPSGEGVANVIIDDFIGVPAGPVFAKIDVEGHEMEALAGMRRLLAATPCYLQIEVFADRRARVDAFMRDNGYAAVHEIGEDVYYTRGGSPWGGR